VAEKDRLISHYARQKVMHRATIFWRSLYLRERGRLLTRGHEVPALVITKAEIF